MIGLSTYVSIYIYLTYLSAPMSIPLRCSTEPKSILKFQNQAYISITYPEKKDSMNQYFGLSSKEIITRFTVFFVLIVKQRRYFGKKRSLNLFVEVTLRRNSFPEVYLS